MYEQREPIDLNKLTKISKSDFLFKMFQELGEVKYLYDKQHMGIYDTVIRRGFIHESSSEEKVLNEFKNSLKNVRSAI